VIDHLGIRVPELDQARAFYTLALQLLNGPELAESDQYLEWSDFSIARASAERPVTRRLHVAFTARDRKQVSWWWEAMRDAGHPDLGPPGPRPEYSPSYYGAFIADPAGNSIEAVHHDHTRTDGEIIDHVWLRVRDLDASTRFYATIAPTIGAQLITRADRTTIRRASGPPSVSLVQGDPTEHVHLAFTAPDTHTVDAFHHAGIQAGYTSLGQPGERPHYHPGYYASYLQDPDHHNLEAVYHQPT
jgi:catechol 2,3-dioxygenase-like lactoylglutathione lyase family enzyme